MPKAAQWANKDKRRAILKLYRSAKGLSFAHDWALDIPKLPTAGALVWGAGDPYVELSVAQRFAATTGTPLTAKFSAAQSYIFRTSARDQLQSQFLVADIVKRNLKKFIEIHASRLTASEQPPTSFRDHPG